MQFILTEEEYDKLLNEIEQGNQKHHKLINDLCQMVADHKPIEEWPGTKQNPVPWGCYKSSEEEWYCDNCPVQKVCRETKVWSK